MEVKDLTLRNELTAFYNDYNETELALFLILCKHIQDNTIGNVEGKSYIQISYKDIFLGKNYTAMELEEVIDNFRKKNIKTILLDDLIDGSNGIILGKKGSSIDNTPFYSIISNREEKIFNCFVNPFLISFIKEIMGNFTILDIKKILNLNGKYARKLYILIARYKNQSENYNTKAPFHIFEVDDLKKLLSYSLEGANKEFFRMLKKSINEIERYIPGLEYESIKTGRTITSVKFTWIKEDKKKIQKKESLLIPQHKKIEKLEVSVNQKEEKEILENNKIYENFLESKEDYQKEILDKAKRIFLKETNSKSLDKLQLTAFNMSKKSIILKILKGE